MLAEMAACRTDHVFAEHGVLACHCQARYNCAMENWRKRISIDPAVLHGKACIRDTRVLVSVVIDNIAVGVPRDEILRSYPALTQGDIDAALAYAAELAREGTANLPLETKA